VDGRNKTRSAIASFLVFFVTALVCYPNYCDRCCYRDIKDAIKVAAAEAPSRVGGVPSCCAWAERSAEPVPDGNPGRKPGGEPPSKSVDHARVPYCIGSTLSTITIRNDILETIRRSIAVATLQLPDVLVVRLPHVVGHAEARAPPSA
jgi:hypothetical protein